MALNTSIARLETKNVTEELLLELGRQELTLAAAGAAADAVEDPQSNRLTVAVGGSAIAAVSQQGLELIEYITRAQTGGVPLCGIPLDGKLGPFMY